MVEKMYIDTKHLLLEEKIKPIQTTYELVIEVWHLFSHYLERRRGMGNGFIWYVICIV